MVDPQGTREHSRPIAKQFPPFELQAAPEALLALQRGLTGFAIEKIGTSVGTVWLRDAAGNVWAIGDDTRSLQFKFEVFALAIQTLEELRARWTEWKPPQMPADMPENFRSLFSTKPPTPQGSNNFEPWKFRSWRVDVLRRVEYIVEDVDVGPPFGDNPNMQGAAKPGAVPIDAAATCDVAVGLLFTSDDGRRLLIGVGWRPGDMVFSQEPAEIDEYLVPCIAVAVADYLRGDRADR